MLYTIQTHSDGPHWTDDRDLHFHYRFHSSAGHPCAQAAFEALAREGQYARLVGWEDYKGRPPRVYAETGRAT